MHDILISTDSQGKAATLNRWGGKQKIPVDGLVLALALALALA